jgi:hypothetical protein
MSSCLKIGHRLLDGDQIISALVRYKLLEPLVSQVLLDEVIQEVPLSKQELFQTLVGGTDAPVPEDFEGFVNRWCQYKGVTPDYFNGVVLREVRMQKFKHYQFSNQIESEFLRSKSELDQVEYSLIQINDLAFAQELYFQLRDDDVAFDQLAQQYSLGDEREVGGLIGPVPLSTLPVEVATLFRNQQVGIVYGPVPIADTFWIVRLEHYIAARLTEETRSQLINRLYTQWLQSQVRQLIDTPGTIAVQSHPVNSPSLAPTHENDK